MNKIIIAIVVLLLIIGAGLYLLDQSVPEDAEVQDQERMEAQDDENDAGDTTTTEDDTTSETDTNEESTDDADPQEHVISLEGFNYGFSQEEIRVQEGDTVTINFTSTDGFHDWVVEAFGAQTDRVSTGETATVTFTADEAGTYEFYCSVGNHRQQGMVGTLIVE